MVEEWRDVPGLEGRYRVSNLGFIESCATGRGMTPTSSGKSGYLQVRLAGKNYRIHRLVATLFIGEPSGDVNHKDGNKRNNHVNNLEWCSRAQNMRHAAANGLVAMGSRNAAARLDENTVRSIRQQRDAGVRLTAIAKSLGIKLTTAWFVFHDKTWRHVHA